jgi:hypothetical protein
MAKSFVPTSPRRIPYSVVKTFVEALDLNVEHVTQIWIGPQGITAQLRIPLSSGAIAELVDAHPGISMHGDATMIEASLSFAIEPPVAKR